MTVLETIKRVRLSQIEPAVQRATPKMGLMSYQRVQKYTRALKKGAKFPPIDIHKNISTAKKPWKITDGHHRYYAHLAAKRKTIKAEIV
jgi:hypothetical protein